MMTFKAAILAAMVRHRAASLAHRTATSIASSTATYTNRTASRAGIEARRRSTRLSIDFTINNMAAFSSRSEAPPPPPPPPPPGADQQPRIPLALSTICLTILAHKTRTLMHTRNSYDCEGASRQGVRPSDTLRPEIVLVAGYLLKTWVRTAHTGKIMEFLPPVNSSKAATAPLLIDESDEQCMQLLNEAYPPLIAVTTPEQSPHAEVDQTVVDAAIRNIDSGQKDLLSTSAISTKNLIADLQESLHIVASTILNLASDWVTSVTTLQRPFNEFKEELGFLREYLALCVTANQALNLPLFFPSEIETDDSGAIVKLKRPAWVIIIRMLARSLAGALVVVAPYLSDNRGTPYIESSVGDLDSKTMWGLGLPEELLTSEYDKMIKNGHDELDAW